MAHCRCDACKLRDTERKRVQRAERKLAGVCVTCGSIAEHASDGRALTLCAYHRRYYGLQERKARQPT